MGHKAKSLSLCLGFFLLSGALASTTPAHSQLSFDARRLKTGTFVYRDVQGTADVGNSEITVERISGTDIFRFSNVVTGKFSQHWQAVTTSSFGPISANLSFGEGAGTPAFDLNYSSGRVTGFVVNRKEHTAGTKRLINDAVPRGVVDQRVDWAAVTGSDLKPGRTFEFNVYDPSLGISHVLVRIGNVQHVRVPAGAFETYAIVYEIKKRTGTETYTVFVSKEEPRILVREQFPDGTESDLASTTTNEVKEIPKNSR